MATNAVLYRLGVVDPATKKRNRHPLFSADGNDPMRSAKLVQAAVKALAEADKQGTEIVLQAVLETRDADEMGRLTNVEFAQINLDDFSVGKSVAEISALD